MKGIFSVGFHTFSWAAAQLNCERNVGPFKQVGKHPFHTTGNYDRDPNNVNNMISGEERPEICSVSVWASAKHQNIGRPPSRTLRSTWWTVLSGWSSRKTLRGLWTRQWRQSRGTRGEWTALIYICDMEVVVHLLVRKMIRIAHTLHIHSMKVDNIQFCGFT